jgi:hypothetical protein
MISQNCPKCGSNRVRHGYRPTPLWSKLIFRYHLLCDNCNWEFKGFAVPGTVSSKPTRRPKKQTLAVGSVEENSNFLESSNFLSEPPIEAADRAETEDGIMARESSATDETGKAVSTNGGVSDVEEIETDSAKKPRKTKKKVKIKL